MFLEFLYCYYNVLNTCSFFLNILIYLNYTTLKNNYSNIGTKTLFVKLKKSPTLHQNSLYIYFQAIKGKKLLIIHAYIYLKNEKYKIK